MWSVHLILGLFYFHVSAGGPGRKGFGPGEQDWGYVEVRPGAHMFWWLYYTTNTQVTNYYEKPLLIWLQGGPGASSLIGNFEEFGPIDIHKKSRNHTWVKDYNVLFIDNPVGTGFSYVDRKSSLTKTNSEIGTDLMKFINQFMDKLVRFRNVPTYIASQSYGGKMAVEWALKWYEAQESRKIQTKLMGVFLGSSWISPIDNVMAWAPYLFNARLISKDTFEELQVLNEYLKSMADEKDWESAQLFYGHMMDRISQYTKNSSVYNILSGDSNNDTILAEFVNSQVRPALNIKRNWTVENFAVSDALKADFMRPVTSTVEKLLNATTLKVIVYTGQLDLIVNSLGTERWIQSLRWKHTRDWRTNMTRKPLIVNGKTEGFYKSYGNFGLYWVDRAGHYVPNDNPIAMSAILKRVIGV